MQTGCSCARILSRLISPKWMYCNYTAVGSDIPHSRLCNVRSRISRGPSPCCVHSHWFGSIHCQIWQLYITSQINIRSYIGQIGLAGSLVIVTIGSGTEMKRNVIGEETKDEPVQPVFSPIANWMIQNSINTNKDGLCFLSLWLTHAHHLKCVCSDSGIQQ